MLLPLILSAALMPGAAEAADIPKVEYKLQLDRYDINTVDYRFPSGLRILFQADHTQPIVSITNWFDRGSVYDGVNSKGESVEGIAHAVEHLAFRAKHGDLPKNWDVMRYKKNPTESRLIVPMISARTCGGESKRGVNCTAIPVAAIVSVESTTHTRPPSRGPPVIEATGAHIDQISNKPESRTPPMVIV